MSSFNLGVAYLQGCCPPTRSGRLPGGESGASSQQIWGTVLLLYRAAFPLSPLQRQKDGFKSFCEGRALCSGSGALVSQPRRLTPCFGTELSEPNSSCH